MDINIIASCSNERNNEHIFSLLKNRDKSKNHVIISPDRSLFSLEKRLFDELEESCFFDVNVISLSRLSKKVLNNVNNKNILTKQSGVALVKKLLHDNKDKLMVFKKAIDYMGFATSLFEMICLYKSCDIGVSDVYVDDSNSYANLKQKDIKLIYAEYEKYLQNEYTDSFNQLMLFAELIDKETFKNTIFYFVEFDDFTRLIYKIIIKLSRFSDGIYIACTYNKDKSNSNIYSNKVYYDLIDMYKSEGLDFKINKLSNFTNVTKKSLAENLFSYNPQNSVVDKNINIRNFENIKDEVKFVVADIYSHALTNKRSFSDYMIILPSITDYLDTIQEEVSKYGIPFYVDQSDCLVNNCFIRLLFNIADMLEGEFSLSDFTDIIKSPILNFDIEQVNSYDLYLKRIGAVGNMCLREDKASDENLAGFITFIKEQEKQVKLCKLAGEYLHVIRNIYEYIVSRSVEFQTTFNSIELRTFNQVVNKVENINNDYMGVFGCLEITSFSEFMEVYKTYFESTNISLPPITSNTLFIADINTSYINKTPYIYVLGCNEGKMPIMQLDNGLVTDEEINKLPNANKINPTIAMLNSRRLFKLFEVNFKWTLRYNLSYIKSSGDGKQYPNTLINSYKKLGYEDKSCSFMLDVINSSLQRVEESNIIFNNLTPKVAEHNIVTYLRNWNIYNTLPNYRVVVSSLAETLTNKQIINFVKDNREDSNYSLLKNIRFFKNNSTSISQIECYNSCPYKHFLKYGIRLKDAKDYKLKPNDIGTIIHEVLKDLVSYIVKEECGDEKVVCDLAHKLLSRVLDTDQYKEIINNISNAYIVKALYKEIDRVAIAVLTELSSSNFIPTKHELYFNNIMTFNGISVKGFIDRIDETQDGFIIIDYKTGDNQFSNYNDVVSGKKLQLLIYCKAYQLKSKKKPCGAFYMPLSNGFGKENDYLYRFNGVMLNSDDNIVNMDRGLVNSNYKSKTVNLYTTSTGKVYSSSFYKNMCVSQEDFDYLLDYATRQVNRSINRIMSGDISPLPLKDGGWTACDYCDYIAICKFAGKNYKDVQSVPDMECLKNLGENNGDI